MKRNLRGAPQPLDETMAESRNVTPAIEAVPVEIRRAVLEKQLELWNSKAADHFGAYEVNLAINKGNTRVIQHHFMEMNQALAAAARVKELISELPKEVKA